MQSYQYTSSVQDMFDSTSEETEFLENDILSGDPFLQGTFNPTIEGFFEAIRPELSFADLCSDLLDIEEEVQANSPPRNDQMQPHADHSYSTSVPENSDNVIVFEGTVIGTYDDYPFEPFNIKPEYGIGLTNQEEAGNLHRTLQDFTEASESDFSRSSLTSPSFTDCDMSSTCTDISSSTSKRGRPRKSLDVHLSKLVKGKATKTTRNNLASMKYRHKKSNKKQITASQLTLLQNRNEELAAKHQKLARDIAMLQLFLSSY